MHVAMIDPSLFTWPYDCELALALRRAGHEVLIYGSDSRLNGQARGDASSLLRNHFYQGFHQKRWLSFSRAATLVAKGLNHIVSMGRLVRDLSESRPDAIHFQWTPLPVVDRSFLPRLRAIAPLVLTVHDSTPFNGTPNSSLQNLGARSIAREFDRIIVHTRAAVDRVAAQGVDRGRINVIPHGPLSLPAASEVHGSPAGSPKVRLLIFGKIKPYKGLDVLLPALANLPEDLRDRWHLHVVGEPHMNVDAIVQLAKQCGVDDRVTFDFRFVKEEEIPQLFSSSDLLVMPYREIDASGVLMSALAAGLPIVASRLGLFAEMLIDGQHGRLVEPGNMGELSGALAALIGNPTLLPYMGLQVRRLAANVPDWDEIAHLTSRLYADARNSVSISLVSTRRCEAGK